MNTAFDQVRRGQEGNYLFPFFWQHDGHSDELPDRIQAIHDSGCRAFCLESRPFEDFCGDSWWANLDIILREARKRDMKVWILDDKHFPTGYANGIVETKYPQRKRWYLREHHVDLMGPAREMSLLVPPCAGEEQLLAVCAFRRTGEDEELEGAPLPVAFSAGDKYLYLDVPEGCWRLFFLYKTPGTTSYINMLSEEGPQALIEAVYEPHYQHYSAYFGNTIAGFFSDEPSLDSLYIGPWGADEGFYYRTVGQPGNALPWDDQLAGEMESVPVHMLPFLWYSAKEAPRVRLAYMDAVTKLWRRNFSFQLGNWCREHGIMYIGHIIEDMNVHARMGCSAGHFFRALAGQDMSGIDIVLHQVMPGMGRYKTAARISEGLADPDFFHYMLAQLAASQARQEPQMQGRAMCEVFGAFGWAEGTPFMKWLIDFLLVRGVNHFVPHAFTDFFPDPDCPPHFFADGHNPQFPSFSRLMAYANRAAHLFYGADMEAAGAILYHAEAEWMGVEARMLTQVPAKACYDAHIPCEIVSIDFLAQAQAKGGRFAANGREYGFLVVPACAYLPEAFWRAARKLSQGGVPVFFVDAPPELDGPLPGVRVSLKELPELILERGLAHAYRCGAELLRIARFDREGSTVFFLFNEEPCLVDEPVRFPLDGRYVRIKLAEDIYEEGSAQDGLVQVRLEPGESVMLMWNGTQERFPEITQWKLLRTLDQQWDISLMESGFDNEYVPYKEQSPLFNLTGRQGKPDFSGMMKYEAVVALDARPRLCLDLGQVGVTAKLTVNGQDLDWRLSAPYRWDISHVAREGENHIKSSPPTLWQTGCGTRSPS